MPDKNVQADVENVTSIKQLKMKFMEELGKTEKKLDPSIGIEHLRFFCLGKEL